ncbi:MAG: pilus assembly protein [Algiphilus sp.]|uniref:TadE/TadG family type IV pilus assembly protein n=1 Tax=Algiphilus sp. TaxID=1872431 RepID=UPI0032EDE0FB
MNRYSNFKFRGGQHGLVAVEFAIVFPLLFMLTYATIVYSYVFVINESIHYAAKTAAESAVRVDPQAADYTTLVRTTARNAASNTLAWMPAAQRARFADQEGDLFGTVTIEELDGNPIVRVVLDFDVSATTPAIFPVISLPLVGDVPPMPARMQASAVALL